MLNDHASEFVGYTFARGTDYQVNVWTLDGDSISLGTFPHNQASRIVEAIREAFQTWPIQP